MAEVVEEVALEPHQPQQLPGKPGELQLWHWNVPKLLAPDGGGGDDGDCSQLQDGLVQKLEERLKSKQSVAVGEEEVHQGRLLLLGPSGCPNWPSTFIHLQSNEVKSYPSMTVGDQLNGEVRLDLGLMRFS